MTSYLRPYMDTIRAAPTNSSDLTHMYTVCFNYCMPYWTILHCQSYRDALFYRLVLKRLLLKFANVIKVRVHTLIANLSYMVVSF